MTQLKTYTIKQLLILNAFNILATIFATTTSPEEAKANIHSDTASTPNSNYQLTYCFISYYFVLVNINFLNEFKNAFFLNTLYE